jgi:S1-C subfamily serine protease
LITAIGQQAVETPSEVQLAVEAAKVGEPLAVTIERDGQLQTIEVNPAELPQPPKRG